MFSNMRMLLEFVIMFGACLCAFAITFYLADWATQDDEEDEDGSDDDAKEDPGARQGRGRGGRKRLGQGWFSLTTPVLPVPPQIQSGAASAFASSSPFKANLALNPTAVKRSSPMRTGSSMSLKVHTPYDMPAAAMATKMRRRASTSSLPSDAHLPNDTPAAATVAKMRRRASLPSLETHLPYDMPAATTVAEMRRRASSNSLPHMLELEEDRWRKP